MKRHWLNLDLTVQVKGRHLYFRIQDKMVHSSPSHAQVVCGSSDKKCWSEYTSLALE